MTDHEHEWYKSMSVYPEGIGLRELDDPYWVEVCVSDPACGNRRIVPMEQSEVEVERTRHGLPPWKGAGEQ